MDPLFMYRGVRFAGQPLSPLQKIAYRVLSITANSASCERLFSSFGTILTKLRSRLGVQNLLNVAELRMHLRDEYMYKTGPRESLKRKRQLATTAANTNNNSSARVVAPAAISSPTSLTTPNPAASTTALPTSTDCDSLESLTDPDDEDSFASIARSLQERSQCDDAAGNVDFTPQVEKIKLKVLFNFSNTTWADIIRKTAVKSLDEEMELYELVEMDAEGEADDGDILCDPMLSK